MLTIVYKARLMPRGHIKLPIMAAGAPLVTPPPIPLEAVCENRPLQHHAYPLTSNPEA
jgi:hypothetical protein